MNKGHNKLLAIDLLNSNVTVNQQKFKLTASQRQIWVIEKMWRDDIFAMLSNNISIAFDLHGNINIQNLFKAVTLTLSNHEIFRCNLNESGGEPYWELRSSLSGSVSITDHCDDLDHYLSEAIKVDFNSGNGKLFAIEIIRVSDDHTILLCVISHFLVDGWAIRLLFKELSKTYNSLEAGFYNENRADSRLPKCASLAVDPVDRLPALVEGCEADLYWRNQLSNVPHQLDYCLPQNALPPGSSKFKGIGISLNISKQVLSSLKVKSARLNVRLSTILFCAYSLLIGSYVSNNQFLIGFLTSGRTGQNKRKIGSFFNTIPVRVDVSGYEEINAYLKASQENITKALNYSEIPFEELVNRYCMERSVARSPLIQAVFSYEKAAHDALKLGDASASYRDLNRGVTQNDIVFHCHEMDSGLLCTLDCNVSLFEDWMVVGLMEHYENILLRIADEEISVQEIVKLPPSHVEKIKKWNDTAHSFDNRLTNIIESFDEQVVANPDKVALVFENQTLTYRQLYERSCYVASIIVDRNLSRQVIGVHMERSLNLFCIIYGVIRACAAYLPIETSLPTTRKEYMVDVSSCALVFTDQPDFNHPTVPHLLIETVFFENVSLVEMKAFPLIQTKDLAYIIFTSGSTGLPKGVMVEHASIFNRLAWMQAYYVLNPKHRVLFKTPIGFDVSVWEIFWPLMYGATTVIAKPDGHKDAAYIEKLMADAEINFAHFVPSMLSVFLETVEAPEQIGINHVICSGEELSLDLQQRFYNAFPKAVLSNLYGPTEAAIDVSVWLCDPNSTAPRVPIGKPIANTQLYILDVKKQLSPIGAVGELYIGGRNVARGYVNLIEETREKFPNTLAEIAGQRFYKTGDLCRYRADGNIEYLGRSDFQIKIRGQRLEISEIEIQLRAISNISECCVLPHGTGSDLVLVAFIKKCNSRDWTVAQLKKNLRLRLPEYMIPQYIVFVDSIPTTINGKVDRRSLLCNFTKNDGLPIASSDGHGEVDLINLCAEVLNVAPSKIDLKLSFFANGGNSLLANVLVKRIVDFFGVRLPVTKVFEFRSLSDIAAYISFSINSDSPQVTSGSVNSKYILENISASLQDLIHRYNVPGVSIAVRFASREYYCTAGFRHTDKNLPLETDNMFRIGCLVKLLTATLAMIFVEEKLITLDDPIKEKWKDFSTLDPHATKNITLRHLLTHVSGLDDQFFLTNGMPEFSSSEEFLSQLKLCPQLSPVGSNAVYSSLGYVIIARFLEHISGESYTELLSKKIFSPLNITEYSYAPFDHPACALEGHKYTSLGDLTQVAVSSHGVPSGLLPAIGNDLMMSAKALLQFAQSFLRDTEQRLLSIDSIILMTGFHRALRGDPGFSGVGFGFYHAYGGGVGLKGNGEGHQSFLNILPERSMAIVFIGNAYPCEPMYMDLYKSITGLDYIQHVEDYDLFDMDDVLGKYTSSFGSVLVEGIPGCGLKISLSSRLEKETFRVEKFDASGMCTFLNEDNISCSLSFYYPGSEGALYLNINGRIFRRNPVILQ